MISDNDGKAYLKEMADLSLWCQDDSLLMSVATTKELIVDFRRAQQQRTYTPLRINGTIVERVSSFKYQGVHITEDLTWTAQTDRKARQCLYHLRQLWKFRVSLRILQSFYSGAVESILTGNITAWFDKSSAQDRRADRATGATLPSLQDLYIKVQNQSL